MVSRKKQWHHLLDEAAGGEPDYDYRPSSSHHHHHKKQSPWWWPF